MQIVSKFSGEKIKISSADISTQHAKRLIILAYSQQTHNVVTTSLQRHDVAATL